MVTVITSMAIRARSACNVRRLTGPVPVTATAAANLSKRSQRPAAGVRRRCRRGAVSASSVVRRSAEGNHDQIRMESGCPVGGHDVMDAAGLGSFRRVGLAAVVDGAGTKGFCGAGAPVGGVA